MNRKTILFALSSVLAIALFGCRSQQASIDNLQREYDQLGQQYRKDCFQELTNIGAKLSPKCVDEKQQLGDAWNRLQAARLKK